MVMDVTPSPQCVGREFVRQYYTLLNKAPTHVHRFYNNNSSFVHGGLEAFNREGMPAVGQKQIHQCIQQLNFRDCHAKITQVDSQATLGNGVVVQVTGELSNGGQPMRRFTQTFVLGAQSPKQYYVHNDIFRYQDLVFGDEDPEAEPHHYEQEDEEPEHQQPPEIQQESPQIDQSQYYASAPPMPTEHPIVNGTVHVDETPVPPEPVSQPPPPSTTPTYVHEPHTTHQQVHQPVPRGENWRAVEMMMADEEFEEDDKQQPLEEFDLTLEQEQSSVDNNQFSSNEPKTYASTLVKSGGGVSNFNISPTAPAKSPPSPPPTMTRLESRNNETNMSSNRGMGGSMRPPRGTNMRGMSRPSMDRPPMSRPNIEDNRDRDYGNRDESSGMEQERRRLPNTQAMYSDDHQLFLGNLPLNASESDLKDLFRKFGNIVDLRIMSKNNMKGQAGNKVPNYGFIIFESAQATLDVLASRPIFFPDDNGTKLNVEEKKTRPRGTDSGGRGGPRPGGNPMMRGGSMSRGGQRGGFTRGGGGGMRPGGFTQRGGSR